MSELTFEEYRQLVEKQSRALLDAIQEVALGNLDVEVKIPEGIEVLSELAIGVEIMVDDLKTMMGEQMRADLVEEQSRVLLDVIQSVAIGDMDVQIPELEGVDVLSDLAIGLEMMIDDLREMLREQERARLEVERGRQQLEAALDEVLAVQRRYLRQEWEEYAATPETSRGYLREGDEDNPTEDAWLPGMASAVERADTAIEGDDNGATLAVPIQLYDEVIGVLGLSRDESSLWSQEDVEAVEAIVEQVAWALENQRLFDDEQRSRQLLGQRVGELDCLNDIGRKMDEVPPIPELLEWVAQRIPPAMQHPGLCVAAIEHEDQAYGSPEAGTLPRHIVQTMTIGGERIGRIVIAYTEDRDFLDEESALIGDIGRRVSGYIENQRLLQETQERAERERQVRTITDRVRQGTDRAAIMHTALQELGRMLGASESFIRLGTPEELRAKPFDAIMDLDVALERRSETLSQTTQMPAEGGE
jgi:GAF domain-containing protein/HAMP domain-containing protein